MKTILFFTSLLVISFQSFFGQNDYNLRSGLIPQLAPFYHGVASGDPLSDRVIIWTRITPSTAVQPGEVLNVSWRVANDVAMNSIVSTGSTTTSSLKLHLQQRQIVFALLLYLVQITKMDILMPTLLLLKETTLMPYFI
jgi:hypothetical protein